LELAPGLISAAIEIDWNRAGWVDMKIGKVVEVMLVLQAETVSSDL